MCILLMYSNLQSTPLMLVTIMAMLATLSIFMTCRLLKTWHDGSGVYLYRLSVLVRIVECSSRKHTKLNVFQIKLTGGQHYAKKFLTQCFMCK